MPKLIATSTSRGFASSNCHSFNMKAAETCAEKTIFAHTGNFEVNLHPHTIPTSTSYEQFEMSPTLSAEPSSSLLISSPVRGGPASTAFAATKQFALHLGREQGVQDVTKIPSNECILSNFNKTSTKAPRRVSIEQTAKDPFVFDNFFPLGDLPTPSSATSAHTSTTFASTNLKKRKSFSRKRSSMSNLDECNRRESSADPYPSSKVIRTSLKKSPSRWSNLNCLNEHAEQSTQDEMIPFHRISSSSLASSAADELESKEDQSTSFRTVTPMAWGQFTDLDQHHDEQALEF